MKAIILVGGLGTRLRPLTTTQPKSLMPVLNRPFLEYQFDLLREGGVTDVCLAAGRQSKPWESAWRKLNSSRLKLHFSYEPRLLGTGGGIRFAYEYLKYETALDPSPILVFNGDVFFDLDIKQFLRSHLARNAAASVALTSVKDPSRYGLVQLGAGGRIHKFIEKPKRAVSSNLVNAGAYLLNRSWIERIPKNQTVSIERESFPQSLKSGERLFGFRMPGYWNDIGTHESYLNAHRDLLCKETRWTPPKYFRKRGGLAIGSKTRVLVGKRSQLGKNVRLEGFVCLGADVQVEDGSRLRDCVILDGARIGADVQLSGSIIGPRSRIGNNATIKEGAVLGPETFLPSYTRC